MKPIRSARHSTLIEVQEKKMAMSFFESEENFDSMYILKPDLSKEALYGNMKIIREEFSLCYSSTN